MDNNSPDLLPPVQVPRSEDARIDSATEETGSFSSNSEKEAAQSIEAGISAPPPQPSTIPAHSDATQSLVAVSQDQNNNTQTQAASQAATPHLADDNDLIEKEWVEKAKEIVNKTKHDPYRQNKEMTFMKADYLKKRYNKEIKLSEDNK